MEMIGAMLMLFGSLFHFLGALGVFRMPDAYNKMQAGTKATTLGSFLFIIGTGLQFADIIPYGKVILLVLFIIFTNPISSHVLARAAHFSGVKLTSRSVRDCLKTDQQKEEGGCK